MGTETVHSIRGSTASSAVPGPRTFDGPPGPPHEPGEPPEPDRTRHPVGDALRAVGVFLDTAFRVVVLGTDGTRQSDPPRRPVIADRPRRGRPRRG